MTPRVPWQPVHHLQEFHACSGHTSHLALPAGCSCLACGAGQGKMLGYPVTFSKSSWLAVHHLQEFHILWAHPSHLALSSGCSCLACGVGQGKMLGYPMTIFKSWLPVHHLKSFHACPGHTSHMFLPAGCFCLDRRVGQDKKKRLSSYHLHEFLAHSTTVRSLHPFQSPSLSKRRPHD